MQVERRGNYLPVKESDTAPGRSHASEQAARVLALIRDAGEAGATRTEISAELGMPIQTVCPRVSALIEAGLAYERGTRDGGKVVRVVPR